MRGARYNNEQSAYLDSETWKWIFAVLGTNGIDLTINAMYSSQKSSMTITLPVYMWHKKAKTPILLNSGATHNFIDKGAVKQLGLGTHELSQPQRV